VLAFSVDSEEKVMGWEALAGRQLAVKSPAEYNRPVMEIQYTTRPT
jgi:hypothetical protein